MELALRRPLCFFDLETTGIDVARDRIVEISVLKVFPNGNKESHTWLVNPEMLIPESASAVHGITDDKVANEPTFKQLAPTINFDYLTLVFSFRNFMAVKTFLEYSGKSAVWIQLKYPGS